MEKISFENPWIKRVRILSQLLVLSVAINVGMGLALASIHFQRQEVRQKVRSIEVLKTEGHADLIRHFFHLSFSELLSELSNKTLIQDGYTHRDLALACLVNYHFFHIDKALSGVALQKRKMVFVHPEGGESFDLELYPGLQDIHYQMIVSYAKREAWPLTPEGLFFELKRLAERAPNDLVAAFFSTSHFHTVYTILSRYFDKLPREKVLLMLISGDFDLLDQFVRAEQERGSFSLESFREILHLYVKRGSSHAASIWIKADSDYLLRNLDDHELSRIVRAIDEGGLSVHLFLKQLLCGVRSDAVRKMAGLKLYQLEGVDLKENYDHEAVLARFIPQFFSAPEPRLKESYTPIQKKHLVEEGDSLWKISRQYKCTIEELREINHLKSDTLRPGREILLP